MATDIPTLIHGMSTGICIQLMTETHTMPMSIPMTVKRKSKRTKPYGIPIPISINQSPTATAMGVINTIAIPIKKWQRLKRHQKYQRITYNPDQSELAPSENALKVRNLTSIQDFPAARTR